VECPECRIDIATDPDDTDVYCPWCGARNPECFETLALAELQALEELTREERLARPEWAFDPTGGRPGACPSP
jgi:hypothetical protein